jgi:hypothetical protein
MLRNAEAARLLAGWGHLLQAGVDEGEGLAVLGEQAQDPGLQALLRAAAPDPRRLPAALEAHGEALDSWVVVLLGVAPRSGPHLLAAAALLEREGGWTRALLWARLALLRQAGAPPGEAFGALAREARDHGKANLAEALYAAAKRARTGSTFLEALRPSAAQLAPTEKLVVLAAREATLAGALAALEGLAASGAGEVAPAAAAPSGDSGRQPRERAPAPGLVDRAAAGAAPLKRGLERVLSGIEEALGIGGPDAEKTARARELLAGRAQRTDAPAVTPAPRATPAPAGPLTPETRAEPAPEAEPEPRRKTIGMTSGPVPKVGYTAAESVSVDRPPRPLTREEWVLALDAARGQLAVLELQPGDAPLARSLERELERLRVTVPTGDRRLLEQLDDLVLRLMTWRQRQ